ncbi:hypothetical protein MU852_04170 [Brevundimonas albigilva]|uniref:hypothetical protein n=1 Tax=Brevundimonas albigilva TaxID=1312364 RepID=UPI00201B7032|nr:hypothetical protein [Brevundimonas albigilva]UQV19067.1 hypothetical protein MU852_04170 [Brevundimonas albigilva]
MSPAVTLEAASVASTFTPAALTVWMQEQALNAAEREALDDLCHNLDLIGRTPLRCEVDWALARVREAGQ